MIEHPQEYIESVAFFAIAKGLGQLEANLWAKIMEGNAAAGNAILSSKLDQTVLKGIFTTLGITSEVAGMVGLDRVFSAVQGKEHEITAEEVLPMITIAILTRCRAKGKIGNNPRGSGNNPGGHGNRRAEEAERKAQRNGWNIKKIKNQLIKEFHPDRNNAESIFREKMKRDMNEKEKIKFQKNMKEYNEKITKYAQEINNDFDFRKRSQNQQSKEYRAKRLYEKFDQQDATARDIRKQQEEINLLIKEYIEDKIKKIRKTKGGQLFQRFFETNNELFWKFRALNENETTSNSPEFQEIGKQVEHECFKMEGILTEKMINQIKGLEQVVSSFYNIIYLFFPRYNNII